MGDDREMVGTGDELVLDKMTSTCPMMMWLVSRMMIWLVVMKLAQSPMKMAQVLHIEQWRWRKRNELGWEVDYTVCLVMKAIPQLEVEWI